MDTVHRWLVVMTVLEIASHESRRHTELIRLQDYSVVTGIAFHFDIQEVMDFLEEIGVV